MANAELNPRDWRDIQVLRAQGMLAELHTVDLENADRGLRAYAAMTGIALHTVARQVVDRELTISREMCVPAPAPRRPHCTDRYRRREGRQSQPGRGTGVDQEVDPESARAER
jgi:ANTAR domain